MAENKDIAAPDTKKSPPILLPVSRSGSPAQTMADVALEGDRTADLPLETALSFSRVFVAGFASTIEMQLLNRSPFTLEAVEVVLESRGLSGAATSRLARLFPGQARRVLVEVDPERPGNFILHVSVKLRTEGRQLALQGHRSLNINAAPQNANISINLSDIQINSGSGPNAALGADYGNVQIGNLLGPNVVRSLNDLLGLEMPAQFQPLELALDYTVSAEALDEARTSLRGGLTIPRSLLTVAQPGTLLRLLPESGGGGVRAIHLIAQPEFRLGRSSQEAHLLTWFLPRSAESDERTRRLSKVHVIAGIQQGRPAVRDHGSSNGSWLDEQRLAPDHWEPLPPRAILRLGADYILDVTRADSGLAGDLNIANLRQWPGPGAVAPEVRGAVRFNPVNNPPAEHDTLWLFTDVAAGSSRNNPVVIEAPGVAEIQGRFHFFRGCFWFENNVSNNAVQVDSLAIWPGEIVPLANGQRLRLGQAVLSVHVDR